MHALDTVENATGVLVVHGIGAQEPGETMRKLLAGLRRIEPDLASEAYREGDLTTVGGRPVRFHEVYWADLLKGDTMSGAFQMQEMQSVAWFPFLNWKRGNYPKGSYSFPKLLWWFVALPVVNFFVLFTYYGASLLATLVAGIVEAPRESTGAGSVLRKASDLAKRARLPNRVDRLLDEYAGDVFAYVNSAAAAFSPDATGRSANSPSQRVFVAIMDRFYEKILRAKEHGCGDIHVVAHSLGTVIAYHALSGVGLDRETGSRVDAVCAACAGIRHVHTIGSPLEKFRFFWPRIALSQLVLAGPDLHWDNFVSYFDPVAGTLRRFGDGRRLANHHLLGGGFLRGHIVYERSSVFLEHFAQALVARGIRPSGTMWLRFIDMLVLLVETLLAPAALAFLIVCGAGLFVCTAFLFPFLLSLTVRFFLPVETWAPIVDFIGWIFLGALVLASVSGPILRGIEVHSRFWRVPHA